MSVKKGESVRETKEKGYLEGLSRPLPQILDEIDENIKFAAELSHKLKSLEERLAKIEASLPAEKVIVLREISKKNAEKEILNLFSKGRALYYSDIAERLNLDLQLVVEICNKLQKSGEIEIDDNALRSR